MKRFFSVVLVLLLCLSLFPAVSAAEVIPETDPIYDLLPDSKGIYVFNRETGTVMYQRGQDTRMYPASTTKIMTTLVVLELCPDPKNTTITCPDTSMFSYIIEDGGVNMSLSQGEVLSVYDVLTGLMMNSYCDAGDLLAWHFGNGNIRAFVEKMNEKAAQLGLENTHFENPHGLHHDNHYSTPKEVALFFEEALKNPLFREIISTREYTIPANNRHKERKLRYTVDIYYKTNSMYLDCFVGGKSGFTDAAGRCLATLSEKDGVSYISVMLGANLNGSSSPNRSWSDTYELMRHIYDHYELRTLVQANQVLGEIPVRDSEVKIPVVAGKTVQVLVRKDAATAVRTVLPKTVSHTDVTMDGKAGSLHYSVNGEDRAEEVSVLWQWDGTPIPVKGELEKTASSVWDSVSGIFRKDPIFVTLLILLLVTVGISIPALKITRALHRKKSHRPKH